MEKPTTDIQILKDLETGIIARGLELKDVEAIFLKDSGLAEEVEKAQIDKEKLEGEIKVLTEDSKSLEDQKKKAVKSTATAMAKTMGEVLPDGKAIFSISDDGVFIGWDLKDEKRAYEGLSGGEKATFDSALSHALKANILVVEAAEMDNERLKKFLFETDTLNSQMIVNTCHAPAMIPDEYNMITVGNV